MQNILLLLWKFILYYYYCALQILNIGPPKIQPKLVSELCTEYIEKEKQKFLATYENLSNDDANTSIHPIFYDTDAYKNATATENNELEQYWKRRILFENTPRGNVIMHYDAYKLGFTYYSDISIPYSLLNAVAMKYVRIYKCRDFFMDTHITPESLPSPFIVRSKEKEEPSKETSTKPEKTPIPKSKAFAKLKQYNAVSSKVAENNMEASNASKNISNIMISMGKINNFSFIPKEKKHEHISTTTKPLSYNDYKRQFNEHMANT